MLNEFKRILFPLILLATLLSLSACNADTEEKVLRVVTDIDCLSLSPRLDYDIITLSQAQSGLDTFKNILNYFGDTPNNLTIQLEILPRDSDLYESELTKIRTEIMAGGGPDVFLMSGFGGCDPYLPDNTLFQNPEAAMSSGLFLPLDEYMQQSDFMQTDKFNSTVMSVGKYDGKQYIMPIYYRLPKGVIFKKSSEIKLPENLDEMLYGSEEIQNAYIENLLTVGFRGVFFDKIADNANKKLLINKEQLFQRTKKAIMLYAQFCEQDFSKRGYGELAYELENAGGIISNWQFDPCEIIELPFDKSRSLGWFGQYFGFFNKSTINQEQYPSSYFVPRNTHGGVTASIETWCAINANTDYPEDAFYVLDIFLSQEFQRMEKFWGKEPEHSIAHNTVPMFWMATMGTIPVQSDIGTQMTFRRTQLFNEMTEAIIEGQEEVDTVFFTSNLDREIDSMFHEFILKIEAGEELSDEDIRRRTDRCWSALRMMLG